MAYSDLVRTPTTFARYKAASIMTTDPDLRSELKLELTDLVTRMASFESSFAASGAVAKYGVDFPLCAQRPKWLQMGKNRDCFNNAAAYAVVRDDVWYAEGYATEPGLPFPVQHAWLVDDAGKVIDPTWSDTPDHVYQGIAFRRDFVCSMLELSGDQAGILVNLDFLGQQHREPGSLEAALIAGAVSLAA